MKPSSLAPYIFLLFVPFFGAIAQNAGSKVDRIFMANEGVKVYIPSREEIYPVVQSPEIVYSVAHHDATDTVYWSTGDVIYRANGTDGTGIEAVVNTTKCKNNIFPKIV